LRQKVRFPDGRNLNKLVQSLHGERIQYMQKFKSSRLDTPEDDEAMIEKITITE